MNIFGLEISRKKAAPPASTAVGDRGNWWTPLIRESFTGAWQRNVEVRPDTVLTYGAVFRCVSLISSDIAKLPIRLVMLDGNGIWTETESPSFSPVLRKPNGYQNRIQFFESWVNSKLIHGETKLLKERDARGIVTALHVLNPLRARTLVTPTGEVYYQLNEDDLAGLENSVTVPASEIIHDRWNTIYHPLQGISAIAACGISAIQGLNIQNSSAKFFKNGAQPSGILTAPGAITNETAERLKSEWETRFSGENSGRTAVLGDGLKYEQMSINPNDAQLIEQLRWTAENVCSVFGVPSYKVGIGAPPANNNIEALDAQYYAQCLQIHIESIELCLDEGLGLDTAKDGKKLGTEFDLDNLLRMDTATLVKAQAEAVGAGIMTPNEGRRRLNLGPKTGGESPYLQQQNYSLEALAKRDALDDPFGTAKPNSADAPSSPAADTPPANDNADQLQAMAALVELHKGFR